MAEPSFYVHSGAYAPAGAAKACALGFLVTLVLAACYAAILDHNPWPPGNALAVILYGIAVGSIHGKTVRRFRIRNVVMIYAIAGGLVALGYFGHWLFYLDLNSDVQGTLLLLANPAIAWDGVLYFSQNPPYEIFETTPSAIVVWVIWAFELAAFSAATYAGVAVVAGQGGNIYCETCGIWIDNAVYTGLLVAADCDLLIKSARETGNVTPIVELRAAADPEDGGEYLQVKLDSCPSCEELNVVDIYRVTYTADDGGDLSSTLVNAVDNLLVDKATVERIFEQHELAATL